MTGPGLRVFDASAASAAVPVFRDAYVEIYAEPPYGEGPADVAEFEEHFAHHAATRPGFRLVLAHDPAAGELTGFGYGFRLPADTSWWTGLQPPPDPGFVVETGKRTFAAIELAVRAPWRRRGIATALHTALLDGTGVERSTLTVRPEAEAAPARAAYARWGYRPIGRRRPQPDGPLYITMVRR